MKKKSFKILVLILVALHIYLIFMRWIYWMLDYHYGDFDYIFLKLVDVPNGFEVVDNLYNEVLFDIYYLAFSTIVTIIIAVKYIKQQKKKMKKIIIYISIMVSNCASLGAQSRELTATANLSKGGDSIHYDFITATVPQSSSFSEQLWDFSNSKYLGQEKEVFFVGNDSNRIKMIDKDAILDFSQDKEHLLLKHLQTPLLNIDFGNSFEYLKFPFPLNDSLVCQIEGKGTYCSKNKLVLSGTCCTKTMAKGKLIMPYNDSLNNTLLIQRNIVANINVSKDSLMSVKQDEPMKFKAAIFEWYAMGYRYPILKIIEVSIKKGERKVLEQSFAYAANIEGMSHLEDEQNKELKDKMRGISLEPNTKQGDISYKVSVSGKKVCLSYSLVSDAQLRLLICNTSGMVFKSASLQQQAGNDYRKDFNCSGLPLGEYVLYLYVNGKAYSEKVILK